MATLTHLPNELIPIIAHFLPAQKDISSFMRCSWRLYNILQRFLYKLNIHHHHASALPFAAKNGYIDLIRKLLDLGASIASFDNDDKNDDGDDDNGQDSKPPASPIVYAIAGGQTEILKLLVLESRPAQAATKEQLRPALHWAIRARDTEFLELLLSKGVPLDERATLTQDSALNTAVSSNAGYTIIERLLEAGAPIVEDDEEFLWAEAAKTPGAELLKIFLKHGRQPTSDQLICDLAAEDNREDLIKKGASPHLRCGLRLTCGNGCNCGINPREPVYSTVWIAVAKRRFEILELLVKEGVRPDAQDFAWAVDKGNTEAVNLLSQFSYEDVPEKMDVWSYISLKQEEKGTTDSKFYPETYLQYPCPRDWRYRLPKGTSFIECFCVEEESETDPPSGDDDF
ncbi:ankyrin repeat-containing domain protein [Aspergillus karnatakaensis]|uniref:ankyrin repeat domain-containing protein n=1 Tax=Aspergillus karnatakaensis TaxID=1810916 RepID=UPI003CCCA94D